MTSITVALVVLAAGWIYVRLWLRTRYMALKEAGHPQYFAAAVAGVFLLLMGASFHKWAGATFASWYPTLVSTLLSVLPEGGDDKSGGMDKAALTAFAACATWSLCLAGILPWFLNMPLTRNRMLLRATMKRAGAFDAIDHISSHSLDCGIPVAVSLKNKKVYVGSPMALSTLDIERKWLVFFPLLSGFRDDEMKLDLPVSYGAVYEKIFQEAPAEAAKLVNEFRVVIAFSEIVSVQAFNINTYYERFKRDHALEDGATTASQVGVNELEATDAPETEIRWGEDVERLARTPITEFSPGERKRLRIYYAFVSLMTTSFVVLPYSMLATLVMLGLASLCAIRSAKAETPGTPA